MKTRTTHSWSKTCMNLGLALLISGACMQLTAAAKDALIVQDGAGRAEIVIAVDAVPVIRLAAEQLQADIAAMSGATLPIVNEPTDKDLARIFVGRSPYTDQLGIEIADLADGAYRMISGDDWLVLVGRDRRLLDQRRESCREMLLLARSRPNSEDQNKLWEKWHGLTGENWGLPFGQYWKMYNPKLDVSQLDEHGSFNAVVDFLRMQGVRRYMRGELGVVMPENTTIALPRVNKTVRPDFPVRYAYEHGHRGDIMWQMWMGFNPAADIQGIAYNFHGISEITGARGNPLIDEEKPSEYYALFGGKRDIGGKQCLSSEKLFEANVKYVRALFDVFDEPMVSVMPSDSYQTLCQCEKCQGKSDPDRDYQGRLSNYVWDYVNRVAQEVYKTHPDRKIVCLAYGANRLPPTNIDRFSPNVVVSIVQHRRNFAYDHAAFEHTLALRRGFLDLLPGEGPRLLQDDHYRMTLGVPGYYMRSIIKDLRSLKGISMGDFLDIDNDRDCQGIRHLNKYITGRFWWDTDQDLDAMLDEYYEKFYGPARAEMKAFIEYSEANWPGMINDQESIDTARRLLAAAQARVEPDSVYGQRVALVAANIKPLTYRANQLARARPDAPLQLMAERSGQAVILDGKLDDPIWKVGAKKFSGILRNADGSQARPQTHYIPVWSGDTLYIGIHCQGLPKIAANHGADDQDQRDLQYDETVDILLETQIHSYYQIYVNPAGILTNASYEDGTPEFRWSSNAQVATHIGEDYWSAEFRIPIAGREQREVDPLDGVAGFMPTHAHPWYFNVCRQRGRGDDRQIMSFSPTGDDIHNSDRFGRMVRHHLAQPR